jgi:DNA-binding IscR family transcriptional regulator
MNLAEVVGPLDPALLDETCLLGNPSCSDHNSCAVHERWKRVKEPLLAFFARTTVADVLGGGAVVP